MQVWVPLSWKRKFMGKGDRLSWWVPRGQQVRHSELNMRSLWCAGDKTPKKQDLPWFCNPGQTSAEVQNRGTSQSTKRCYVLQTLLWKVSVGWQPQRIWVCSSYIYVGQCLYWIWIDAGILIRAKIFTRWEYKQHRNCTDIHLLGQLSTCFFRTASILLNLP